MAFQAFTTCVGGSASFWLGDQDGIKATRRVWNGDCSGASGSRDRIFIGGEWVEPEGGEPIEVVNSTTEEVMGTIPACSAADADRAVVAAREAFDSWSRTSREERAGYIAAIAAGLGERSEEIAATITQELGMPLKLSQMIQVGLPTAQFGAMPKLMEEVALGGGDRQLAGAARAGRRARRDHALELPAEPDRLQGRPRARRRLHRRAQAERGRAAQRLHPRRGDRGGRPARRRLQPRHRHRPGRRRGDRRPPRRRHGLLHRLDPRRQAGHRAGLGRPSSRWRWSSAASRRT